MTAVTPGSAKLLALAEAVGRIVPEHSSDRKVLLEAERALRLAAKPAEDGYLARSFQAMTTNNIKALWFGVAVFTICIVGYAITKSIAG